MKIHIKILSFILVFGSFYTWSQQNLIPISSYYKDKLFSPFKSTSFSNGSFLPVTESEIDLIKNIVDSSKQYYQFTSYLIKKHLIEIKGEDYYLTISPTLNVNYGEDKSDSLGTKLFQNTRGFHIEGDFYKNFSFSSSFYENQARFTEYEKRYYLSNGELYPNGNLYSLQNAVIPGGGRTKPFKVDGFDYAFAIGSFIYAPTKKIRISGGNNSHFIGSGYRSLLLSDNSIYTPYIQTNIKLSSKLSFVYMRSRLMNLIRRPFSSNVESYYNPKGLSINYLTYKPNNTFNISLFEGIIWSKGDSVSSTPLNPFYYNPIPLISEFTVQNSNKMNSLLGLNTEYIISTKHRIYNQLAISNLDFKYVGFQLGYRGYDFGGLRNFMLQLEYNNVPKLLYTSNNKNLNYSNYNLPLAHTKGNSFKEFIIRSNYEYQRCYIDVKIIVYHLEDYIEGNLKAAMINKTIKNGNLQHEQLEIGYRFNRKLNLCLYGSYIYRNDASSTIYPTKYFSVGIRTGLINNYTDF